MTSGRKIAPQVPACLECGKTLTPKNVRGGCYCSRRCYCSGYAAERAAHYRSLGLRCDGKPYKVGPPGSPRFTRPRVELPPPARRGPPRKPPADPATERRRANARDYRRQEYQRLKANPEALERHRAQARERMRRLYARRLEAGLTVNGRAPDDPRKRRGRKPKQQEDATNA